MAPRFPLGYTLQVGYLGLYRADTTATTRNGKPVSPPYTIQGLRLFPAAEEIEAGEGGPAGYRIAYPKGWEYMVARVDHQGDYHERGWFTETELLAAGYGPPPTQLERFRDWKETQDRLRRPTEQFENEQAADRAAWTESEIRDAYLDTNGGE